MRRFLCGACPLPSWPPQFPSLGLKFSAFYHWEQKERITKYGNCKRGANVPSGRSSTSCAKKRETRKTQNSKENPQTPVDFTDPVWSPTGLGMEGKGVAGEGILEDEGGGDQENTRSMHFFTSFFKITFSFRYTTDLHLSFITL